uniref:Uncharacterized protein n=1 Tax=Nicotiana tabacum TaxID=4097 RepID=A0A1S4A0D5_TOBAC|nr:PREDICTED: uncharacterized protein LOC107792326 [Nicotiana tabacum]
MKVVLKLQFQNTSNFSYKTPLNSHKNQQKSAPKTPFYTNSGRGVVVRKAGLNLGGRKAEAEKMFGLMDEFLKNDAVSLQKDILDHVEFTVARSRFNFDDFEAYQIMVLVPTVHEVHQILAYEDLRFCYWSQQYVRCVSSDSCIRRLEVDLLASADLEVPLLFPLLLFIAFEIVVYISDSVCKTSSCSCIRDSVSLEVNIIT